eukprot:2751315-Rhodomonas_salina.1
MDHTSYGMAGTERAVPTTLTSCIEIACSGPSYAMSGTEIVYAPIRLISVLASALRRSRRKISELTDRRLFPLAFPGYGVVLGSDCIIGCCALTCDDVFAGLSVCPSLCPSLSGRGQQHRAAIREHQKGTCPYVPGADYIILSTDREYHDPYKSSWDTATYEIPSPTPCPSCSLCRGQHRHRVHHALDRASGDGGSPLQPRVIRVMRVGSGSVSCDATLCDDGLSESESQCARGRWPETRSLRPPLPVV